MFALLNYYHFLKNKKLIILYLIKNSIELFQNI